MLTKNFANRKKIRVIIRDIGNLFTEGIANVAEIRD